MRLSVTVYSPGNHTMVPTGTHSNILKVPAELNPGPLQVKSGSHRLPPGSRRGGGGSGYPACCPPKISPLPWRISTGAPPTPCRTGLIRGIFLAGARVTFELELKVTRGPRGLKNWTAGSFRVPCRTAKKTAKDSPGTAREGPFVKCDQGMGLSDTTRHIIFTYFKTLCFVF